MRSQKFSGILLIFVLLSVFFSPVAAAPATTVSPSPRNTPPLADFAQTACSNLDVVFVVDQSDSMSRNDATNNRKYAVEGMVDLLVDLAMNQCPDNYHRIGVISFGSAGKTRVDVEMYDINPSTSDGARRIREELRPRIEADNLGATYPEPAFEEAYRMFNRNILNDGQERKKVIIFITDGLPCGSGQCEGSDYNATTAQLRSLVESRFPFADDLKNLENCTANVRKDYPNDLPPADKMTTCIEANGVLPSSYENSTYLFTLLLHNSDEDYVPSAVSQLETLSAEHAGYLVKNQSENQIPSTLRKILSQLVGVRPSLLTGPNFAVNPYLNKMIVTAYKRSVDVQFTLSYTDANGQVHTMQGGQDSDGFTLDPDNGYYQFGANETYTILNPYPGIWTMSSSNPAGLDVYYQAIDGSLRQTVPVTQVPQYDREPFYNADDPFYLEFTLYDDASNGAVVPQSDKALFAVETQVKVTAPDGKEVTYPLKWNADDKSFRADQPLQVPLAGQYKIAITGTTHRHEGEPVVGSANESAVFDKQITLFSVTGEFAGLDVTPFEVAPVSPTVGINAGSVHATILSGWPLKVQPLQVRVRLTDENGSPLADPDTIFINPADAIQAQLTYLPEAKENEEPDETVSTEKITLQPDPAVPGEFIASFPNFEHEGAHILTLTIGNDKMEQGYWPYRREVKVEFTRTDCLFCRAGTYYTLLGMLIAFILAIIAYNIAIRTNKVAGTLVFKDGITTLAEFGLGSGVNFRKIGRRELDSYPHLMLKRMKIYNAGKKRRASVKADDAVNDSYYGDDSLGIVVECVGVDGRKFNVNLEPNFPTVYADEAIAQMIYEPIEG